MAKPVVSLAACSMLVFLACLAGNGRAAPSTPASPAIAVIGPVSTSTSPASSPHSAAVTQMPSRPGAGKTSMPPHAAMVLQQMHMVNAFEIKAAKLALQKASGTLVRRYADRLRRDHEVADGKVKGLADKLGYQLHSPHQMRQMMMRMMHKRGAMMGSSPMPSSSQKTMMQKMHKAMQMMQHAMTKLQSASGPTFDHVYLKTMVKGHKKAIHMLEHVQTKKSGQSQVANLVQKLLPILKQHLHLAQQLLRHKG